MQEDTQPPVTPQPGQQVAASSVQSVPQPLAPKNPEVDPSQTTVAWSASEYVHHQKNGTWYLALTGVTVMLAAASLFLLHDKFAPIMIVVMGIALGMLGARQPSTLKYRIDPSGLTLGPKHYGFEYFKSFSTMYEDNILSLQLNPMKRFMPAISIYFDPQQADQIATTLGLFLPHEEKETDAVDIIARLLRF